jgi:hypothetical protein
MRAEGVTVRPHGMAAAAPGVLRSEGVLAAERLEIEP